MQCYDYFEAARGDLEHVLNHLYKMIEMIQDECGGETEALQALPDVAATIKHLKRVANDRGEQSRDQRHAPKGPETGDTLDAEEQAAFLEDGPAILRKFEERFYGWWDSPVLQFVDDALCERHDEQDKHVQTFDDNLRL